MARDPLAFETLAETAKAVEMGPPPARNRARFPFKGTIALPGLPLIRVETPKGDTRSGTDRDGNPWSVVMPAHYGEFARTEGVDGDPVDVFVGPDEHAAHAYVAHMAVPGTTRYDEDKVLCGFRTRDEAEAILRRAYNRPGLVLGLRKLTIPALAAWLADPARRGRKITAGAELAKAAADDAPRCCGEAMTRCRCKDAWHCNACGRRGRPETAKSAIVLIWRR